jgi:hypothetical protein
MSVFLYDLNTAVFTTKELRTFFLPGKVLIFLFTPVLFTVLVFAVYYILAKHLMYFSTKRGKNQVVLCKKIFDKTLCARGSTS